MRKPDKGKLKVKLLKGVNTVTLIVPGSIIVVDGGHLLHAVKWRIDGTFADVANQYVDYLYRQFKRVVFIVFDGYGNGPNVKDHEHRRRGKRQSPDVVFDKSGPVHKNQDEFLANENNKHAFVSFLISHLMSYGHSG
jgi:hypothetical protein